MLRRSNLSTTTVNTKFFGLGRERYFIYSALWLGIAVFITAMTAGNAFDYYRLRSKGILTDGTAVAKAAHDGVTYSFKVNGVAYQGVGTAGFGTAPYGRISIGDRLPIYYLPKEPQTNCLGSPEKLFSNEIIPVLLGVILVPTAIVFRVAWAQKKRRSLANS